MDTQTIEIIGRNRLVNELLVAGLEVALPLRDHGIDLIAYVDKGEQVTEFHGCPIQMKAASSRSFLIDKKYRSFPNLLIAYVWNLDEPDHAVTYALTYEESIGIGDSMGWTQTTSWTDHGRYTTSQPSPQLMALLEPYRMDEGRWREKVTNFQE